MTDTQIGIWLCPIGTPYLVRSPIHYITTICSTSLGQYRLSRLVGLPGIRRECKFWAKGFGWGEFFTIFFYLSIAYFEVRVDGLIGILKMGHRLFSRGSLIGDIGFWKF